MRRRIVLHIGLQKTGTSSIQIMLDGSQKYLKSKGYYFPQLPVANSDQQTSVWLSPFRHNILASTLADYKSAFDSFNSEQKCCFISALKENEMTPIISAEGISRQKDFSIYREVLADFEVEVVIYLRQQDRFVESLYNQRNKILVQRGDPGFLDEKFLTEPDLFNFLRQQSYIKLLNFEDLLGRIESQLVPHKIHVRVFDRSMLRNGDVCADFAEILSLDRDQLFSPPAETNDSIGNEVLIKLKRASLDHGLEAAKRKLSEIHCAWSMQKNLSGPYQLMSDISRESFMKEYAESNARIKDKYGVILGS